MVAFLNSMCPGYILNLIHIPDSKKKILFYLELVIINELKKGAYKSHLQKKVQTYR